MIEWTDTSPDANVEPQEYQRLLGYPRGYVMKGRALELVERARAWYVEHGRPWTYAREAKSLEIAGETIRIEGVDFTSPRLLETLRKAGAERAVLAAVGAGPEIEDEAQKLWRDEKPDEYFFLEVYGSAVVERLTMMTGARLCVWAEHQGLAVLPHYSPGYPEWDIVEQPRLLELMALPQLEALDSGALRPKKSLLAVFGLTRHTERLRPLSELVPCENCSLAGCQYRRAPQRSIFAVGAPLETGATYAVSQKALKRWAKERLTLEVSADGAVDARFRYDGTTCSNMGRPLAFDYRVKLGPREEGYPIREQQCAPAAGDTGHTVMCGYLKDPEGLTAAIQSEKPLAGQPLNAVLSWQHSYSPAGCYCEPASREHKWGLVLETIHYALARKESEERNE